MICHEGVVRMINSMLKYFLFLGFLLVCISGIGQSKKIDSLKRILPEAPGDTRFLVIEALYCEVIKTDIAEARKYLDLRFHDSSLLRDSFKICEDYNQYGLLNSKEGDYELAEDFLLKSLNVAQRNNFEPILKYIYQNLASLYAQLGKYDLTLEYHFKSLERRKLDGNSTQISVTFNNIGFVYELIRDQKNALKFYHRSLALKMREKIDWGVVTAMTNIAGIHLESGNYDSALIYSRRAEECCQKNKCILNDTWELNQMIGSVFVKGGRFKEAEEHLYASLAIARELNFKSMIMNSFISIAKLNLARQNSDVAIHYLDSANAILQTNYAAKAELNILDCYAKAYDLTGNYKSKSEYIDKLRGLENKLFGGDFIRRITDITTLFESTRSKNMIDMQRELLSLKDKAISQERKISFVSAVAIGLLIIIALLLWIGIRARSRINVMLDSKVKERTRELQQSNQALYRKSIEQDSIINKFNHNIRATQATLSGLINTASKDLADNPEAEDYLKKMKSETDKLDFEYLEHVRQNETIEEKS